MGTSNLAWREITNGISFLMQLAIWATVMLFLIRRLRRIGLNYWRDDALQLGIALGVYFLGSYISRGGTWVMFLAQTIDLNPVLIETVTFTGTIISVIGGMCLIKVLQRPQHGGWSWIVAGTLSLVIPAVVYVIAHRVWF